MPGTQKKLCEKSMTLPTPRSVSRQSTNSPKISKTPGCPKRPIRLGRTLWSWRTQISNWHKAKVTNAATESANKRVKRGAFGFTNFANYRIRTLLYAGKPNWALLETLTPT